jgi:hypothetical protein
MQSECKWSGAIPAIFVSAHPTHDYQNTVLGPKGWNILPCACLSAHKA